MLQASSKKIALVTTHYPPLVGGAATYFSLLAKHLAASGMSVVVITTTVDGQPRRERANGVEVLRVLPTLARGPAILRRWGQALGAFYQLKLLRLRGRVDVVHTHASKSITVGAALFSAVWHVPVVFDVQDFLSRPRILRLGFRRRYVATGQAIAQYLKGLGIGEPQIAIISSIPPDESRRPVTRSEHKNPTIIFVGELHREIKGEDVLLRAFAELRPSVPNVRLVLVGDGPDRPRDERLAAELQLSGTVTFRGQLPPPLLMQELDAADVLAVASHTEGMPRVILEAFARGLPVVATRVGGIPEVVQDGHNGYLVPPNDPSALAAALGKIVRDDKARWELGRQGRTWIDSLPNWAELTATIAASYES